LQIFSEKIFEMKTCTKCNTPKPLDAFSKDASRRDGAHPHCKACNSAAYRANAEKKKAQAAAWRIANPERKAANNRAWAAANPEKDRAAKRKWDENNKDAKRAYYRANFDKIAATKSAYRLANKERMSQFRRKWGQENRGRINASVRDRQAAKLRATPAWADPAAIRSFYETADGLNMLLGEWHHVDHIVPLRGKTVCGLHVRHNLRVVTARANLAKSNSHWPDMP
jgi:hypothetical protein